MSTSDRCASGARSPEEPTEPRLGTTGVTWCSSISTSCSTTSTRTPERPRRSELASRNIIPRTISSASGSPAPTEWERSRLSCSCAASSGAIETVTRSPKPVFTPYTVRPLRSASSTTPRASAMRARSSSPSGGGDPPRATASSSSSVAIPSQPIVPLVIEDVLLVPLLGGYFNEDQAAQRTGVRGSRVPSRALGIGLVLAGGQVVWGDAVSVQYAGAAGGGGPPPPAGGAPGGRL